MGILTTIADLNRLRGRRRLTSLLPQAQSILQGIPQSLSQPQPPLQRSKMGLLTLMGLIASALAFSTTSYAGLSASTAKTIEGTPPYLSYDGGVTPTTNTDKFVTIWLSNGASYTKSDAGATQATPIVLPAGDTFGDIVTYLPPGASTVDLTTLINYHNYAFDDDGDGNYTATGNLTISIKDVNNATVNLTDIPNACSAPYKLTLTSNAGTLTTQFGTPNSSTFKASTATYYINSSIVTPIACFAKPNLSLGTNQYAGPTTQWDPKKGFIPQIENGLGPTNFPTTGFNGAYFDLTLGNTTAAQVRASSGNGSGHAFATNGASNVILILNVVSPNVLRVILAGPSMSDPIAVTGLPATFELKSGTTTVYNFTLGKWFIPKSGNQSVPDYCASIPGFRVPSVVEYTNAFPAAQIGIGGSTGGHYTRQIYWGGVFGEWGTVTSYYTLSDWEMNNYWASDAWSAIFHYYVGSSTGNIFYNDSSFGSPSLPYFRVACVSP